MYNGEFNGGFCKCKCIRRSGNEEVNYLASYRFMIKIGNEYGKGKTYTSVSKADIPGLTDTSYSRIRSMMANLQKKSFFKNYSNANKKACVFGVAMHTSTDTFAHSTYRYYNGTWYSITHAINEKKVSIRKMRQTILSLYQKDLIWHIVQREIHYIVIREKDLMLQYVMISMQQMIQINIIHQILRSK